RAAPSDRVTKVATGQPKPLSLTSFARADSVSASLARSSESSPPRTSPAPSRRRRAAWNFCLRARRARKNAANAESTVRKTASEAADAGGEPDQVEQEDRQHRDLRAELPGDLADPGDAALAVLHARDVHDDVHRLGDQGRHRVFAERGPRHAEHGHEAGHRVL